MNATHNDSLQPSTFLDAPAADKASQTTHPHPPRKPLPRATATSRPSLQSPAHNHHQLAEALTPEELALCKRTTLIIGFRNSNTDNTRATNLRFLLKWLSRHYGEIFDILIIEQDQTSRLPECLRTLPPNVRHEFIFNPNAYNRGWGYNVAVKHFCKQSDVVAILDTDVLTGTFFVDSLLACHRHYHAVSPYRNIYYTTPAESEEVQRILGYHSLNRPDGVRNPVTLTGGIVVVRRSSFLAVNGFEQYCGYGGEDRALDVTLLNTYGSASLFTVDEVYVHLHHEPERSGRTNANRIFSHLKHWYRCQYDPQIQPYDYIHANCHHSPANLTDLLSLARNESFADIDLYQQPAASLTCNGKVVRMNDSKSELAPLLPELHLAIREGNLPRAVNLCDAGLTRYEIGGSLYNIFVGKRSEIENRIACSPVDFSPGRLSKRSSDTLVILGNGPSLKYVMGNPEYRKILKTHDTFGLNAAYRAYDELDFWPTYHGCLDMIVVESHLPQYRTILPRLRMMFLLSEDHLGNDIIGFEHPNLTKIRFDPQFRDSNDKIVSTSFTQFRNWQNSGCNCVQIGLMLGYKRIVLLGMDANYKEVLTEAAVVRDSKYTWDHLQIDKEVGSNDNYWFSNYQQVGDKYNIPNASKYHLPAWNALGLSEHKDKIINCTSDTRISTITRRSFEEVFEVRPDYAGLTDQMVVQAINVSAHDLIGNIVRIGSLLFYVMEEHDKPVRKFLPEATFTSLLARPSTHWVLDCDQSLLETPCHGVVTDPALVGPSELRPGLTFMVRARNERQNIYFVLGSLKHILANPRLKCQLLFVDNLSSDGTYDEVLRVCRDQNISNVFLTRYQVDVSKSGDAHSRLEKDSLYRSLDTYYNWCLDRVMTRYVIKWDCDFLALQSNLISLIDSYKLHTDARALAIWCSGKTVFSTGESFFLNESTMYNEFRVFSKQHGYRWQYAPRWEICSQSYMATAEKFAFTHCVFIEQKSLLRNEFEFRSNGSAIRTDTRDGRDAEIVEAIQSASTPDLPSFLKRLNFDPFAPVSFDSPELNAMEATLEELDAMQSYWLNVYSRPEAPFRFQHKGNAVIQGLWVGNKISNFHRLCIESFIRNHHCFVLYTYETVANLPDGVVIRDAHKIIPRSLIYQFDGSYAGFSDLFRNKLLLTNGGWYVDLDIYCMRPFDVRSAIVFSMDYYRQEAADAKKGTGEIIDGKYYVATNPCKLPAGHEIARSMYSTIFKKLVFERLQSVWVDEGAISIETFLERKVDSSAVVRKLKGLGAEVDFESFVGDIGKMPKTLSYRELLDIYGVSIKDIGQKAWGEIGPTLVTREVVSRGLEEHATKPELFQGIVKYFEIEKFLDPDFDFATKLKESNPYSLDLFYTMWRRGGWLESFDIRQPCLFQYIRDSVQGVHPNALKLAEHGHTDPLQACDR
jgi:hypothetical protein